MLKDVKIRKFELKDIENKILWINNPENNTYLHYNLPLQYDETVKWFQNNKDKEDRYDAIIEYNGIPVGLIGLLEIDNKNRKAEYYIMMGEPQYKGKGIAQIASKKLIEYAFNVLLLNRIYLYTEVENISAQKLFKKIGFLKEGILKKDLFFNKKYIDRYIYGLNNISNINNLDRKLINTIIDIDKNTPIQNIRNVNSNNLYIKRDDLFPFSFGGNKARKGILFFKEIDRIDYDCVVTYGSSSSNHCRVIANLAAGKNMPCYIVSPFDESRQDTFNSRLTHLLGAEYTACQVDEVHDTIEKKLTELKGKGCKPYFIPGGGHGIIGTQAYIDCYREISNQASSLGIKFDYIFHASGTGTTQSGLVCGEIIDGGGEQIIGISIARKNPEGRRVVVDSVKEYLAAHDWGVEDTKIEESVVFVDSYTGAGYAQSCDEIKKNIQILWKLHGIPTDSTYTGKAYTGMLNYIKMNDIKNKNILFIHTGGVPLFFDAIDQTIECCK